MRALLLMVGLSVGLASCTSAQIKTAENVAICGFLIPCPHGPRHLVRDENIAPPPQSKPAATPAPQIPQRALAATPVIPIKPAKGDVHYDPQEAFLSVEVKRLEADMTYCEHNAMQAILMQGMRNRNQILDFAKLYCTPAYRNFMNAHGSPPKATDALINLEADQELDAVLAEAR